MKHGRNFSKWMSAALSLALFFSACAPAAAPQESPGAPTAAPTAELTAAPEAADPRALNPGTYTASASGFANEIEVTMTVGEDAILECTAVGPVETNGVGQVVVEKMPAAIVEAQSVGIDVFTGATFTSNGILAAAKECIAQAGGDVDAWSQVEKEEPRETSLEADVLVVGGGLSGICAAVSAAENGAKVILLDKLAFLGGNSALSTGGFMLAGTDVQKAAGVEDSAEAFIEYGVEKGEGKRDINQLEMIGYRGNEVLNWLIGYGAQFNDTVKQTTGCPVKRSHNAKLGTYQIIACMADALEEQGVETHLRTTAKTLLTDESGNVTGVMAEDTSGNTYTIAAKSTILAAGGYAGNAGKIEEYWGLSGLTYVGTIGAVGDMIDAAASVGAALQDMEVIKTTSTVDVTKGILLTGGMLSAGAIIVDSTGSRFCDEAGSKSGLGNIIMDLGPPYVYEIFDQGMADQVAAAAKYMEQGILTQADTIEGLAEACGLPVDALSAAVEEYNEAVRKGEADSFGRTIYTNPMENGPFYAARVYPGLTSTAGGVKIDEQCRVLDGDGNTIGNLYAVGEMAAGYRAYGYVGGDSLAQDAVTGKVAGEYAAAAAKS